MPKNLIASSDRENKVILFESPPQTFFFQQERRDQYMEMIDQENPRQDLMKYAGVLVLDMDYNFNFFQKNRIGYLFLQDSQVTLQK